MNKENESQESKANTDEVGASAVERLVKLHHDTHDFMISMKNYNDCECDIIGYYLCKGYIMTISRKSLYGNIVSSMLAA